VRRLKILGFALGGLVVGLLIILAMIKSSPRQLQ
jgi:hypothetical protein